MLHSARDIFARLGISQLLDKCVHHFFSNTGELKSVVSSVGLVQQHFEKCAADSDLGVYINSEEYSQIGI